MSDIRIDDDGFLVGDNDPANPSPDTQNTAENALLKAVQEGNRAIVSILRETQGLQRDTLKATQEAKKRTRTVRATPPIVPPSPAPRVSLVHPNRPPIVPVVPAPRVNLVHPNRPQPTPPIAPPVVVPPLDTARLNPDRANEAPNAPNSEPSQDANNNKNAAERSATSRITDGLKDLNNTLTVNANTDRIDPMVDAIKEAGSVIGTGVEAGKKVLSVGNTLIAKPAMALGRGIKGLIKPKTDAINSPAAWYKRIWRTLVQGNRQDQAQHNQEQRRLDEIARGQGGRGGDGNGGLLMLLGMGLAALLAAFKNIKIPTVDDIKNAIVDASNNLKEKAKQSIKDLGYDNESLIAPMSIKPPPVQAKVSLNHPARAPQTQPSMLSKAFDWAKDTKVGKAVGWGVKKLPFIGAAIEGGAGGVNAYNIENDQTLTAEQKKLKQAENAVKTGGRIGGGLAGATAGGATALSLTAPTLNPFIIIPSVIGGSILGGIYGADAGGYLGEKAGAGVYKSIKNTPTQKSKKFVEPSAYADRDSEARKLYEEHKPLDVDGSGIITRDEMIKGGRPDLLGKPDAPKSKQVPSSTQADYNKNSEIINDAAARFNVDPKKLTAFAYAESRFKGGDIKASTSTATGMLQFVEDTWAWQIAKSQQPEAQPYQKEAQAYLADKENGMARTQRREKYKHLLDARADNKLNTIMGAQYSRDALNDFAKKGISNPSMAEIYAYHHDGNAERVINARNGNKPALAQLEEWGAILNKGAVYAKNTQVPTASITPTANIPTNSVPSLKTAPVNATPVPNVQSVQSVQAKEQPTRHNTSPTPIKVSMPKPLVGQNVSDRGIAHILTGGIGETV